MEEIADEIKSLKERFGQKTELGRRRTSFEVARKAWRGARRGPDRERAGHSWSCPRRAGSAPSRAISRTRQPHLQGGRPAEARRAHADHRHAALFATNGRFYTLSRQAAERAWPRRALPPDDRHRGGGDAVELFEHAEGRKLLVASTSGHGFIVPRTRSPCLEGQAGAERRHGR